MSVTAAPAKRPGRRVAAAAAEWLFLTAVYQLSDRDAAMEMGRNGRPLSRKAMDRYKRYLRENPEVRAELAADYGALVEEEVVPPQNT